MVTLDIQPFALSLCVTIVSVICEVAFLSGALTFLRFYICRQLDNGKKVPIRAQHLRVLAITFTAMLAFVLLETVTSLFSSSRVTETLIREPCVRTELGAQTRAESSKARQIQARCSSFDDSGVVIFEGSYSIATGNISCSPEFAYSYKENRKILQPVEDAVRSCKRNVCAFVKKKDDTIFLSGPQDRDDTEIQFYPADIAPGRMPTHLSYIAGQLAGEYLEDVSDESVFMRRALMGSFVGECSAPGDQIITTEMPLPLIVATSTVWAASLMLFIFSCLVRKKISFDITHPVHWATTAFQNFKLSKDSKPVGAGLALEVIEVDDVRHIVVTNSLPKIFDDDSSLPPWSGP